MAVMSLNAWISSTRFAFSPCEPSHCFGVRFFARWLPETEGCRR